VKNYFSSIAAQNSRTFKVLSRTYPVLNHCQGPWMSKTEIMYFQGFSSTVYTLSANVWPILTIHTKIYLLWVTILIKIVWKF